MGGRTEQRAACFAFEKLQFEKHRHFLTFGNDAQSLFHKLLRIFVGWIGNDYPKGGQIDWVLGKYTADDMNTLQPSIDTACEIIKSFVLAGIDITMNQFNKLGKK